MPKPTLNPTSFSLASAGTKPPSPPKQIASNPPPSAAHDHDHDSHPKPTPTNFQKYLATHPAKSFIFFFLLNLSSVLLTLGLQLSGTAVVISGDKITQIGLEIPQDVYQKRANGYEAARQEADFGLSGVKCPRSEANRAPLQMILEGSDSANAPDVLTKPSLEKLEAMEQHFLLEEQWPSKCALLWSDPQSCTTPAIYNTAGNSAWIGPNVTDPLGCLLPTSPVSFFHKYGDPTFSNIPQTLARIHDQSPNDWFKLTTLLDKDFDIDNLHSSMLKTMVYYGTPFNNYTYYMKKPTKNPEHYEYYTQEFITEELAELQEYFEGGELIEYLEKNFQGASGLRASYNYVNYNPMQALVLEDISKIVVSICFVFLYMWYSTETFFIASMGMFQIFTSFTSANLIYRFLWPSSDGFGYEYFTLFCGLAMFVIMGIGADDVFVYWDTWVASSENPERFDSKAERVASVYSHAVNAMFVTSFTTVISFFSNLQSSFIGVRTFGLFAGLLVMVNFFSVCTFFPAAVLFYDHYLKSTPFFFGLFTKLKIKAVTTLRERKLCKCLVGVEEPKSEVRLSIMDDNLPPPPPTLSFFKHTYSPFIFKYRMLILALFLCLWGVFAVGALMIKATPLEIHELFPKGDNYYVFVKNALTRFPPSAKPLDVHLVFGIEVDEPVDYGGAKSTEFLPAGDPSGVVSGSVNWERSFEISTPEFQKQFVDTCNEVVDVLQHDPKYKTNNAFGINPQYDDAGSNGVMSDTASANGNGVQCVLNGFELFNTVPGRNKTGVADDGGGGGDVRFEDKFKYIFPPVSGNTWEVSKTNEDTCRYCFDEFTISDLSNEHQSIQNLVTKTSTINSNCNCMGIYPVPNTMCLSEFNYLDVNNPFRCQETNQFLTNLQRYIGMGGNSKNWKNYVYATKDENNKFLKVAMTEITVQTTLSVFDKDAWAGIDMVKHWDAWAENYNAENAKKHNSVKVMVHIEAAPKWKQTILLMPAAISGVVLSLFLAWVVLVFSTENYIIATFAIITISMIVTIVFGFLTFSGWGMGLLEGILVVLVIGFSVDYTVHLSDSYKVSTQPTRFLKVQESLDSVGKSIMSGAVSTVGAAAIMLPANISFFSKFGAFIFLTIILSTMFSLGFYACLLMVCGPIGGAGKLSNLYAGTIKKSEARIRREEVICKKEREASENLTNVHPSNPL